MNDNINKVLKILDDYEAELYAELKKSKFLDSEFFVILKVEVIREIKLRVKKLGEAVK